jgi:hypothetical protein
MLYDLRVVGTELETAFVEAASFAPSLYEKIPRLCDQFPDPLP